MMFFKKMKQSFAAKLMVFTLLTGCLMPAIGTQRVSAAPEQLLGLTAMEVAAQMGKGWNLGNTFDATGGNPKDILSQEQSWGNPVVVKELIDGVRDAGFTTIRIPVTWYKHLSYDGTYTINPEFMERVKTVVDYAYEDGLFIILNIHHESWLNTKDLAENQEKIGEQLEAMWTQISDCFADYDQHLIFEGMNEPRAKDTAHEWNGTAAEYDAINYLNDIFVNTVRGRNKGNNGQRMLMIPGYAASNSGAVLDHLVIPEVDGAPVENIAISVHCYSPYNFCLSDNQTTFNPESSGDTAEITTMFRTLKSKFLDNGIPVVIGECGATNSGNNLDSRVAWFAYFGKMASDYGIPAIVWDNGHNGTSGGECHHYFNRKTGEQSQPELIDAFINGPKPEALTDKLIDFEPVKQDGGMLMPTPQEAGFTSPKLTLQTKINHTEGAGLGFSLKVSSDIEEHAASLDISRYAGLRLYVNAFIKSDANKVTVSMQTDTLTEMMRVGSSEEWTEVGFVCTPSESGETFLVFQGENEENFYIDDINLRIVDETFVAPEFVYEESSSGESTSSGETNAGETVSGGNTSESSSASDQGSSSEPAGADTVAKKSPVGIIVFVVLLFVAGGIGGYIGVKKKKK